MSRRIFQQHPDFGPTFVDDWIAMALRSRIEPFVKLAKTVRAHRDSIFAALDAELSNARLESANTKIARSSFHSVRRTSSSAFVAHATT